jgi:hypothetical protein
VGFGSHQSTLIGGCFTFRTFGAIAVQPCASQEVWISLALIPLSLASKLEPDVDPNTREQHYTGDHDQEDVDDRIGFVSY